MASASGSREKDQPPTLPVKQHRLSSVDSDFTPTGLQHQRFEYSNVFSEDLDCNAVQCPIHQRYDPFEPKMRFFSDGNPPPVPRKKLTRTISLPGIEPPASCSLSPLSPRQRRTQNFDNPLYMMAPIPDAVMHEETEDLKAARRSPTPLQSLSQLSFHSPDEHLGSLFGSFEEQGVVSGGIQHCQLLFLRSMAQSVEDQSTLQVKERDSDSFEPEDFLLYDAGKPKKVGAKTYYVLQSLKFPGTVLGLRVRKGTEPLSSACEKQQRHANVLDVIACFQPTNTTTMQNLPSTGKSDCRAPDPPDGGGSEKVSHCPSMTSLTVRSLLQRGHCVSVERDLPHATLEDFVQDSCSVQHGKTRDYDRRVCVLLLQVLMGSHHLYRNGAAVADLRPREILLVWPRRERSKGADVPEGDGQRGWIQELCRKFGSPRVLVTPLSAAPMAPQALISIKCQIGVLIQFCLRPQEGPNDPSLSTFRRGLLHFSSLLHSQSGPQMTDIIAMLQVLLWGPRLSVFIHRGTSLVTPIHNWLTVKRALLMMKLAEGGMIQDQPGVDWEDLMCLRYLPFTDSETVVGLSMQLCNALC